MSETPNGTATSRETSRCHGWKCYMVLDRLPHRRVPLRHPAALSGRHGLGGECTTVIYDTGTHRPECTGGRFDDTPCERPPGWGCPARCGIHSNVRLGEARHGIPQGAIALTASWGNVIRCDSLIGDAWRAERCTIRHLFLAEHFSTHPAGDPVGALRARYHVPVTVVSSDDPHPSGLVPLADYVKAAERLGLPLDGAAGTNHGA